MLSGGRMNVNRATLARFDADNRESALIVLGEQERYGAGMVEWAELVLLRGKGSGRVAYECPVVGPSLKFGEQQNTRPSLRSNTSHHPLREGFLF